jgi:hypothetical protein
MLHTLRAGGGSSCVMLTAYQLDVVLTHLNWSHV